jgi:hypothetical protein
MAQMVSWPELVDDDGTLTTGSVVGHTFEDSMKTSIEDQVHNTTYTAIKPKNITEEIEDIKAAKAAGSWTDLKDACDGVIDFTDGSLILPATVVDEDALIAAIGGKNLVMNGNCLMTATAAQWFLHWSIDSGTWGIDGDRKVGRLYAINSTRAGTDCAIRQSIVDDIPGLGLGVLQGKKFGFGAWMKCDTANTTQLSLYDGITYTILKHSGSAVWEWVSGVKQISHSATKLEILGEVVTNNTTGKFDGVTVVQGDQPPDRWVPVLMRRKAIMFSFPGAMAVGNSQGRYIFQRPAQLDDVQAFNGVPHDGTPVYPGGGPITIDIEKYGDGSWVSVFSAPKNIVASGNGYGSVQPDGAYGRRGFNGGSSAVVTDLKDSIVQLNLDAVNGAEGFNFVLRFKEFVNPLEEFLAYNDWGQT